jgi:hypothetical protein
MQTRQRSENSTDELLIGFGQKMLIQILDFKPKLPFEMNKYSDEIPPPPTNIYVFAKYIGLGVRSQKYSLFDINQKT